MKNLKSIILFLSLTLSSVGCNFYEGKNVDPDAPTAVNPDDLLKGIQLANIVTQLGQTQRITGMWTGQYRGVQLLYLSLHEYNISAVESNETWNLAYQSVVKQSRLMREGLKADPFYQGVGKIMEAYALGTLTALYGDIPFSEIAQDEKFPNPKFDNQRDVYAGIQTLLDGAITDLKQITAARTVNFDLLFKGAHLKWIEVAYTLKGRYHMETKEYDKAYNAALLGISSGANSLKFVPAGTAIGNSNLMNEMIANRGGYFSTANTFLVTKLLGKTNATGSRNNAKTTEDARAKYFAIVGTSSTTEKGVAATKSPMPLVIYEENLLNLAESGLRTKGVAEGLLQLNKVRAYLATKASFTPIAATDTVKYDAYVAADFAAGGMENKDNLADDKALLREIIEERYVSLYGQILPFNDLRRLAKTEAALRPAIPFNTATATKHPERLIYAQTEINANPNLPKPLPDLYQVTEVNK